MSKNNLYYDKCDRYKKYLDNLSLRLVVKRVGGKYTKEYRELEEKYNKAFKKWEEMCDEPYKKHILESLGFNVTPERDMELYK